MHAFESAGGFKPNIITESVLNLLADKNCIIGWKCPTGGSNKIGLVLSVA